jgi:glycosyltransferase involved in cell wall biosynthesis
MLKQPESYLQSCPTVTVAIPTYNEVANIEQVVKGFFETDYPNLVEILIADGGSTDGTQDIVKSLSLVDSRVKLILNPQKIQAAALNLMLAEAKGDIFLRADAHCDYAPDYIERCVEALLASNALGVGGRQRFVASTAFHAGVSLASRSWLGGGRSKLRNPNYEGFADTLFMGCYWKDTLLKQSRDKSDHSVNLNLSEFKFQKALEVFDTSQITNEDAELNARLRKNQDNALFISPRIRVEYYPRKTIKSLWIQYFKYGRGRFLTLTKHPQKTPIRSKISLIVPLLFFLYISTDLILTQNHLYSLEAIGIGFLIFIIEAVRLTVKYSDNFMTEFWRGNKEEVPSFLSRTFWCCIALMVMPIAYLSGNLYQLLRVKLFQIQGW